MEKLILVVKSITKKQSKKPGWQQADSVKVQQVFLLKGPHKTNMRHWET